MLCPGGSAPLRWPALLSVPTREVLVCSGAPRGGHRDAGRQAPVASGGAPLMQLRPPPDSGEGGPKTVGISTGDRHYRDMEGISCNQQRVKSASPPQSELWSGSGAAQAPAHPPANRGCGPKQAQLGGGGALEARVSVTLLQTGRMRLVLALIIKMEKKKKTKKVVQYFSCKGYYSP